MKERVDQLNQNSIDLDQLKKQSNRENLLTQKRNKLNQEILHAQQVIQNKKNLILSIQQSIQFHQLQAQKRRSFLIDQKIKKAHSISHDDQIQERKIKIQSLLDQKIDTWRQELFQKSFEAEFSKMVQLDQIKEKSILNSDHVKQVQSKKKLDDLLFTQMNFIHNQLTSTTADLNKNILLHQKLKHYQDQNHDASEKYFKHLIQKEMDQVIQQTSFISNDDLLAAAIFDQEQLKIALDHCSDYNFPTLAIQNVIHLSERCAASNKRALEYIKSQSHSN